MSFDGLALFSRSYLDMSKVIIFSYLFWFVLTIIFITGTTRISIFCMGYLVACFYFLLFGGDLLLKPIKSILRYWDWLIAYNVFVITMKNILSVSGSHCVTHLWFQCKSKQSIQWLLKTHHPSHCSLKSPKWDAANSEFKWPFISICFTTLSRIFFFFFPQSQGHMMREYVFVGINSKTYFIN